MLLVYAMLERHPASQICEAFIRERHGWFITAIHLFEIYAVLTKTYGVAPDAASLKTQQLSQGPLAVVSLDATIVGAAIESAFMLKIDIKDAPLIEVCKRVGVTYVATEDQRLNKACSQLGWKLETPLDDPIRQAISDWEAQHLPVKGLPRILTRVHQWLQDQNEETAMQFWNHSGNGNHLP